jgi:hypothetical protein
MNRFALMTSILSLTLVGVAAEAQTQSGSQPKYHQMQPQAGAQQTVPGSTYDTTQQRSQSQPGQQPKLYQNQGQPGALSTQPAPASGMGAVGPATGLTSPYAAAPAQPQPYAQAQPQGYVGQAAPGAPVNTVAPRGTASDVTREIQGALTTAGYKPGAIDGVAGRRTAKAIRKYQGDNGLSRDGAASASLLEHLRTKRT